MDSAYRTFKGLKFICIYRGSIEGCKEYREWCRVFWIEKNNERYFRIVKLRDGTYRLYRSVDTISGKPNLF